MNRVIKFRAWDKGQERMISADIFYLSSLYDYDLSGKYDCYPLSGRIKDAQEHFVFMQYTGLNDTEGREIYEGDILYCPLYEEQEIIPRVVEWVTGQFVLKNLSNDVFFPLYIMHDGKNKIIGNIYENPELMEK